MGWAARVQAPCGLGCSSSPATHLPPEPQGCGAAFSSLMGYQYHQRRCGKPPCEVESPSFPCTHCGKTYRSKAGHDYHVRSEHSAPVSGQSPALPARGHVRVVLPAAGALPSFPVGHVHRGSEPGWASASPARVAPVAHLGPLSCSLLKSPRTRPLRLWTCWVSRGPPAAASAARRPRLPCSTCRRSRRMSWLETGPSGG